MLSIGAYHHPSSSPAATEVIGVRLHVDRVVEEYEVRIEGPATLVHRGSPREPSAAITTDPQTLAAALGSESRWREFLESGRLSVDGDHAAAERLVTAVDLPQTAASIAVR